MTFVPRPSALVFPYAPFPNVVRPFGRCHMWRCHAGSAGKVGTAWVRHYYTYAAQGDLLSAQSCARVAADYHKAEREHWLRAILALCFDVE